jgi:hypothetical protein
MTITAPFLLQRIKSAIGLSANRADQGLSWGNGIGRHAVCARHPLVRTAFAR